MLKNNGFHNRHSPFSRPFSPASFFANGEQGWWYDPSNFATLFQDSAGTTPVTAVEQPVGLQLDLSGRNNHRFQSTSANRPVVSARVNLLTKTEQFNDAVWTTKVNPVYGVTDPNGGTNAVRVTSSASDQNVLRQSNYTSVLGVNYTHRIALRRVSGTGTILISIEGNNRADVTAQVTSSWGYVTASGVNNLASGTNGFFLIILGTSGDSIEVAFPDARVTNQGVGLPAYQRVNTSTDYDSTGFPVYIKPNGSNQFMVTNSINFSATDKMTVWQGVRKLSDAVTFAILAEPTNGAFALQATNSITNTGYRTAQSSAAAATSSGFVAPITNVLTALFDASQTAAANALSIRINGAAISPTFAGVSSISNFGNNPAYFYVRNGASNFFSGNDYGSIARGAASTAAQITAGETYINSLTKAYT